VTGITGLSPAFVPGRTAGVCWAPVRTLLSLLLLLVAIRANAATTYRWVDADGVHYSDQPHVGAEKLTLGEAQTYSAPPAPAVDTRAARTPAASGAYSSCAVVQPADDQVLFETDAVAISMQTAPGLRSGDRASVSVDGKSLEPDAPGQLSFHLRAVERGTHTVSASVLDSAGKVVCQAPRVSFHVRQPSVLAPANPLRKH